MLNADAISPAAADAARGEAHAAVYSIDPTHASARFKVRHLMISNVTGELGEVTGEVLLGARDATRSAVTARIDASAIDTRNSDRDAHLRSPYFLDVATYPAITFRSTRVAALGPGRFTVDGELTVRGVTRSVTLEAEVSEEIRDPWGNVKRGVVATTRLDRKAFGVSWNALMDGGGIVVGDVVEVTIEAEILRREG